MRIEIKKAIRFIVEGIEWYIYNDTFGTLKLLILFHILRNGDLKK